ncbi:alpha-L-fucosidase [Snuella sedimenti]|uniref:alpha-L-fucosidase n=1 Tax=Snuella sedimenti TaxID=2798802 RepID=A0A8J7IQY5_9FLAO|nr:alpha-L-fucosidase [Snuella sedimenti]MBJ6369567.1 alpha-L-fucosidase [Snuella sedimenti]
MNSTNDWSRPRGLFKKYILISRQTSEYQNLNYRIKSVLLIVTILFLGNLYAQHMGGGEANPNLKSPKQAINNFTAMRFGMFIHWGPVSLRGEEIGWSRGKQIPIEEYDNLYKEFNPVLFDAKAWVKAAKDAGMKYIVLTTKHHDGFCLWDSKHTDYDITNSPYKKDVAKQLAVECKKQGLLFGAYYSIADWKHEHYATRYANDTRPLETSDMTIYFQYMKDQLKELIENYDPFLIWFDGGWEDAYTHEMGMELYAYLRTLKKDIIINDRIDKEIEAMTKTDQPRSSKYAGDYLTPEQRIGEFNTNTPWETCMTIAKQWAWKPNDKLKSKKECIQTLLQTVGGDGNLLFNVGPMPDGRIEQRQIDRLKEMGDWLKINGEAVYDTHGGPYLPTDYMVSTKKDNKIYIHLLNNKHQNIKLPFPKGVKIKKAYFLDGKSKVAVNQDKNNITIITPQPLPDPIASVIVLELNKPANAVGIIHRTNY